MLKQLAFYYFKTVLLLKAAIFALLSHVLRMRRSGWKGSPPAEVIVVLDLSLGLGDALMISPALRHLANFTQVTVISRLPDFMECGSVVWRRCRGDLELGQFIDEATQSGVPLFVPRIGMRALLKLVRQHPPALVTGLTAAEWLVDTMTGTLRKSEHRHYTHGVMAALAVFCGGVGLPLPSFSGPARFVPRRSVHFPALAEGAPLIALAPWAHGATRRWPENNVVRTIDLIHEVQPLARFILIGGAEEAFQGDRIREQVAHPERVDNHMGRHSLEVSCALIAACAAMVACDNGPMHLAAGLNIPLLALFGCTAPETRLSGDSARALWDPGLCPTRRAPCHRPLLQNSVCPTQVECMTGLSPERVAHTVLVMLSGHRPSEMVGFL